MEFAARGESGRCFACSHCDIIQAVIAKHPLHRLDDFMKNRSRRRALGQLYAQFEIELAGLDQLDTVGLVVLKIEDQRRQRHLTYTNERRLASLHLKTAKRRSAGAGVLVEPNIGMRSRNTIR